MRTASLDAGDQHSHDPLTSTVTSEATSRARRTGRT